MNEHPAFPYIIETRLGTVKVYHCRNGAKHEFVVNWSVAGNRRREKFADDAKAVARAHEIAADLNKGQTERAALSPHELAEFKAAKNLLGGISLLRAAEYYLEVNAGLAVKNVREVCDAHLAELKLTTGTRHQGATKVAHKIICSAFGERVISGIKREELVTFLTNLKCRQGPRQGLPMSGKSRNNMAIALSGVWSFAQENLGALPKNTKHAASKLPRFAENEEKQIYSPEEAEALFDFAHEEFMNGGIPDWVLATLALKAFTGIRSAEVERLHWQDIKRPDQRILLHKALTKTSEGRIIPIRPALEEWLSLTAKKSGKVCEGNFFRYTRHLAEGAFGKGSDWAKNALRHSFISYSMAESGNAAVTADISGNSIRMVKSVYQTLALPSDASKYFNIKPKGERERDQLDAA